MSAQLVIAARGGPQAKTRLAGRLAAPRREALVEAMLADMLAALQVCPDLAIWVTTPTPALARLAAGFGADVILETATGGLNAAFERARRRIAEEAPESLIMTLPGDLPGFDPADVAACLAAAGEGRLVLAPATADGGTGALVWRADVELPLAFGPGSLGKHLAAARGVGLSTHLVHAASLSCDIDRPADLDAFLALGGGGRTAGLLRDWRVAA